MTYKVIQADRDAAAPWMNGAYGPSCSVGLMDDHQLVRAFAKHREDTEALIVGWLRGVAATHHSHDDYEETSIALGIEDCIASIQRGDHHTNNTPTD